MLIDKNASHVSVDPRVFRTVLGHFPSGVVGVTSMGADGMPAGMVVSSFTSVSLDPPLVAFLPAKTSTTFPKIRESGKFCANVLASTQENVCRAFAAKGGDKFAGVGWHESDATGSPVLDGVVAWIDCTIEAIHDAGDHEIVIGRVRELSVANPTVPLLFFQGGYGRFAPMSFSAQSEPDLVEHLRLADIASKYMSEASAETGVEVLATALVHDEIVTTATSGHPDPDRLPTRVGQRMPFVPPLGAAFVAWSKPERWPANAAANATPEDLDRYRALVQRVKERGWSIGLGSASHRELEAALGRVAVDVPTPEQRRAVQQAIDQLSSEYEPELIDPDKLYPVRNVSVPVFTPTGHVALVLTAYGLPRTSGLSHIHHYRDVLLRASAAITDALRTA